jgi:hypothetical protein
MEENETIGNDPVQAEEGDDMGLNMECSEDIEAGPNVGSGACGYGMQRSPDRLKLVDDVDHACDPLESTFRVKAEPLDHSETEECDYTRIKEHGHTETTGNFCDYIGSEQHDNVGSGACGYGMQRSPDRMKLVDDGDQACDPLESTFHVKAEPLDHSETEECDYTRKREHDHTETTGNLCDYIGSEQHDNIPIKTEPCDEIETEPCDQMKFESESSWDEDKTGTLQYENIEYGNQLEKWKDSRIPDKMVASECGETEESQFMSEVIQIKTEPEDFDDHVPVKYKTRDTDRNVNSDSNPNVCIFPQTTAATESIRISGTHDTVGEESTVGLDLRTPDSVVPRPGQLPIHVVDPLHGDGMKMDEDASLSVTGVVANIHAQVSILCTCKFPGFVILKSCSGEADVAPQSKKCQSLLGVQFWY